MDDRKTTICDNTRRWARAANADAIITELSDTFRSMFQR